MSAFVARLTTLPFFGSTSKSLRLPEFFWPVVLLILFFIALIGLTTLAHQLDLPGQHLSLIHI